jgi:hypothetical protein
MNAGKIEKYLSLFFKRWLVGYLLFFVAACFSNNNSDKTPFLSKQDSTRILAVEERALVQIKNAEKIIHTGDLITRTGNDFTSQMLRQLNQHDKTYSHCGIASIEHDSVFVYHALGGEFNPDQKIRRDAFALFCEPYSDRGFGIFRFQLPIAVLDRITFAAKEYYRAGIMFDMKFDLQTNDRMYCAEFVYKSFLAGTNDKITFNVSHLKGFLYIGVDDIFLSSYCYEVKRIVYK